VAWDLWKHRNGSLHKTEALVQNERLQQELRELWNQQARIRLPSWKGYPISLAQLLQWPMVKQQHWRNLMRTQLERRATGNSYPSYAAERDGMRKFLEGKARKE
jgi:hypothetical protein